MLQKRSTRARQNAVAPRLSPALSSSSRGYVFRQAFSQQNPGPHEANMRIFGIIGGRVILAVVLILFEARPLPTPLLNGERLAKAMARYSKDVYRRGEVLPRTITLDTLVGQDYLNAEDTKPLQGAQLVFHTDAVDMNPQMVLVEAHMPDGQISLMGAFSNLVRAGG